MLLIANKATSKLIHMLIAIKSQYYTKMNINWGKFKRKYKI